MRVAGLGERGLLALLAPLGYPQDAPLPPGDDAGGVWLGKRGLLLKTDGFLYREVALRGMGPFEVGWRAVAATASDLVVKMGRPLGFTLGLFIPPDYPVEEVLALVRGAAAAARAHGAVLLGGDTNKGEEVALTASGYALAQRPLPRAGAPGDLVYLAGDRWGKTGAAIDAHYRGLEVPEAFREAAFYPRARLELLALARLLKGSADSSDGLAETLWQLSEGLGLGVELEALPLFPEVLAYAKRVAFPEGQEEKALSLVLYGGEEFEAVLVVSKENAGRLETKARRLGLPLFRAGWLTEGGGVRFKRVEVERRGYAHF
ncbi:MAG: thiamine-monophosphate kinase [Thermoleophilia bacterium]